MKVLFKNKILVGMNGKLCYNSRYRLYCLFRSEGNEDRVASLLLYSICRNGPHSPPLANNSSGRRYQVNPQTLDGIQLIFSDREFLSSSVSCNAGAVFPSIDSPRGPKNKIWPILAISEGLTRQITTP